MLRPNSESDRFAGESDRIINMLYQHRNVYVPTQLRIWYICRWVRPYYNHALPTQGCIQPCSTKVIKLFQQRLNLSYRALFTFVYSYPNSHIRHYKTLHLRFILEPFSPNKVQLLINSPPHKPARKSKILDPDKRINGLPGFRHGCRPKQYASLLSIINCTDWHLHRDLPIADLIIQFLIAG